MTNLDGKVALVFGGSRGIGEATVRKLSERGASVVFTFKSQRERAEALAGAIRKNGARAEAFTADVADEDSIVQAVNSATAAFGRIDILVNNAGLLRSYPLEEIQFANYAEQFNTHVWGTIAASKAALKHFPSSGGRIINISSLRIREPAAKASLYSASKAAVSTLTHALAIELGPRGITVNAVAPGVTRTDLTAAMPDERRKLLISTTPLGRLGEPEDIASVVAMLASDDARWITGQTILADGGLVGVAR